MDIILHISKAQYYILCFASALLCNTIAITFCKLLRGFWWIYLDKKSCCEGEK